MNPFFETEGVYKINGLIFDVKNTCFDYCVCEFSCISSERINFQELCQHFGLPRFTSILSTAPQRRSFFRFNYFITFLFPKISPIRSSLASQKYPLGNRANNPCFFFSICSKCQLYYFFNKRKENHK